MPALGVFEVSRFYFNRDEKSTAIASAPTQFRKDKRSLACCDLSQLSKPARRSAKKRRQVAAL
jgi:hypothetical protein